VGVGLVGEVGPGHLDRVLPGRRRGLEIDRPWSVDPPDDASRNAPDGRGDLSADLHAPQVTAGEDGDLPAPGITVPFLQDDDVARVRTAFERDDLRKHLSPVAVPKLLDRRPKAHGETGLPPLLAFRPVEGDGALRRSHHPVVERDAVEPYLRDVQSDLAGQDGVGDQTPHRSSPLPRSRSTSTMAMSAATGWSFTSLTPSNVAWRAPGSDSRRCRSPSARTQPRTGVRSAQATLG